MSKYLKIKMKNGDICSINKRNVAFINTSPSEMKNDIFMIGGCHTQIISIDNISFKKTCKKLRIKL